jgi:leucyl-tRNA synthetase
MAAKSQFLRTIESEIQKEWGKAYFESNANDNDKKFMATFPFPYVNGRLHLGHVYSMLKADVMVKHHKILGYNTLFPFGFHGTGIPIVSCAKKLENELASEKGHQYQTMLKMNIPEDDIPQFTDPNHWIQYFPQVAINEDLPKLGCSIDYRRSFITTEINPHFDSFVKWQFNKLHSKNLLRFGKKLTIFSPKDNQPCSDADRTIGEGVEIVCRKIKLIEHSGIKMFVTFHPDTPNHIVKSRDTNFNTYQFSTGVDNPISITMPNHFYRGYSLQQSIWQNHSELIGEPISTELDFPESEFTGGSGLYTSDESGDWIDYYEPESLVVSRNGDQCVVAETDQWFILYDDPEWRNGVYQYTRDHVKFTDDCVRNQILETIEKSHPWPFSRTVGLGSRIPLILYRIPPSTWLFTQFLI